MTAPRKPVAWQCRVTDLSTGAVVHDWADTSQASYDAVGGASHSGSRLRVDYRVLYTAPDLQPLWALVEKWEALETDFAAYKFCARELRQKLEAMQ